MRSPTAGAGANLQFGPPLAVLFLCSVAILAFEVWQLTEHWRWRSVYPDARATMRAVVYEEHGGWDVLKLEEVPQPRLEQGMIKIEVHAAALNPIDFKIRRGAESSSAAPKPKIPGADVAGIVLEAARGTGFQPGEAVFACLPIFGSRWGSLAPIVVADARLFAPAPKTLSLADAAALPLAGLTMLQTLGTLRPPKPGSSILVQAGMGGVGNLAVQYAKHVLGFDEIVVTASAENEAKLLDLGATRVVDYRSLRLPEASDEKFKRLLGPVDVVVDPMSWLYQEKTLRSGLVKPGGTYLTMLTSDWAPNDMEDSLGPFASSVVLKWKHRMANLFDRSSIRYRSIQASPCRLDLQRLARLVDERRLKPVIDHTYIIDDIQEAFRHLETGHAKGKLVVRFK